MREQPKVATDSRLQIILDAVGLDYWENELLSGDVIRGPSKIFSELGYEKDDISSSVANFMLLVHPEDVPSLEQAMYDVVRGTSKRYHCEFRLKAKSGAWVWFANRGKILQEKGREHLKHLVGVTYNVNDRRLREEELARLNSELLAKTALLEKTNAALSTANAAKTRFLASASHDMRQPIQAAALFTHSLKQSLLNARQQEIVAYLDQSIQSIQDLLDRLLDISKLDAGMIEVQRQTFGVHQLFRRMASEFVAQAESKKLKISFHYPQADVFIDGDLHLVTMVLRNFLSNAVSYTNSGGIVVGVRRCGRHALLQVWDSGIGIASDQLERIYDEFYQIDNAHRDRRHGLGLGLAIARRAADLMSAPLRCKSQPGQGTMFELALVRDFHYKVQAVPAVQSTLAQRLFSGKRVVVIEDDVMAAKALTYWLEEQDCFVSLFSNAEDALKEPRVLGADFYISDFRLPGNLDGIAFLDAVRARTQRSFPGVVMTGDTSPDFIARAQRSDWPVMFKPINPDALVDALARLCCTHAASDELALSSAV